MDLNYVFRLERVFLQSQVLMQPSMKVQTLFAARFAADSSVVYTVLKVACIMTDASNSVIFLFIQSSHEGNIHSK